MRYHYQQGTTKKKKGIGRVKLAFFAMALFVLAGGGYGAFLMTLPGIGGWPYQKGDEVVQQVRTMAPGTDGNKIYIPKINVAVPLAVGHAELEGELGSDSSATLRAEKMKLALTPRATIEKSPFFRLDQLAEGDEFFVDYNGTRYAYAVAKDSDKGITLETTDKSVSVRAKPIGVVAWNGGEPRIETTSETMN